MNEINPLNSFLPMAKQIITTMGIAMPSSQEIIATKDKRAILILNIIIAIENDLDESAKKEFDTFKGILYIMGYNLTENEKTLNKIIDILNEYKFK